MEIKTESHGKTQYLAVQGRLDAMTAGDFEKTSEHLLHSGQRLFLMDATGLDYVSSSGIGALVKWTRSLDRAGGACAVIGAASEVRWLLDFFGLSKLLPVFSNAVDAERYLTERGKGASKLSIMTSPPPSGAYARPKPVSFQVEDRSEMRTTQIEQRPEHAPPNPHSGTGTLGENLNTLQTSLEKVIESLERIPDAIREMREQTMTGARTPTSSTRFKEGIVVDCQRCGSHLRIKKSGEHLCPRCAARFSVGSDGNATFSDRLSSWQAQQGTHSASHS